MFLSWLPEWGSSSLLVRGGLVALTTCLLMRLLMPWTIRRFRRWGLVSEGHRVRNVHEPYQGPKPLLGGVVLVFVIFVAVLFWVKWNQFVISSMAIMLAFGAVGALDDAIKVRNQMRAERRKSETLHHKSDGISGYSRLLTECIVALLVVMVLYMFIDIDGHLVVPFISPEDWFPYLPRYVFVPFMILVIVGTANAMNLIDGMDTLAVGPTMTCTLFVSLVIALGAEPAWARLLNLPPLPPDLRELILFSVAILSAVLGFLRYNAPPAMITLGDMGALALGGSIGAIFIFAKVELFLPLVGFVLVLTTFSSIAQRVFFKLMLILQGRSFAERYRLFYKAPYHHHMQISWLHVTQERSIQSVWVKILALLGIRPARPEDLLLSTEAATQRSIWRIHLLNVKAFVLTLLVYFWVNF